MIVDGLLVDDVQRLVCLAFDIGWVGGYWHLHEAGRCVVDWLLLLRCLTVEEMKQRRARRQFEDRCRSAAGGGAGMREGWFSPYSVVWCCCASGGVTVLFV